MSERTQRRNSTTAGTGTTVAGARPEPPAGSTFVPHLDPGATEKSVIVRLVLGSFVMLFIELALIRWLGSNILHLSYFTNFVLLGSFLGIGLGFLIARKSWSILPVSGGLLMLLVLGVFLFPVGLDRTGTSIIYFTAANPSGPPAWLVLPLIFVVVAVLLAGPAEVVGRCFGQLKPLTSYRWDLIGSLSGILTFTLVSFLRAPSLVWGLIASIVLVALNRPGLKLLTGIFGVGIVLVLLAESTTAGVSWSPYYKVLTEDAGTFQGSTLVKISVNGVPHQLMGPAEWKLTEAEAQYRTPYERTVNQSLDNVLIVGAGSGSDVAIALSKGAKHVDAVDIDPRIVQIGEQRNTDRPYQDPRVDVHINDGRAFLESTSTKYDLILFALPDSLALVNGASQIRLESFLFTAQALQAAHDHLKPTGAFSMYNYYREPWLIDRLAGTAAAAFGHQPCVDQTVDHQAVVTIAVDPANQKCANTYQASGPVIAPATDDRPFLYFEGGGIPAMYLWTLFGILLISLIAVRSLGGPFRSMRPYADLFFMGAAFLLLETKNIATFALLFGTTWLVNAMVFAGVLVIVLLAVETTRRFRTPPLPVVWGAILVALALAYVVNPDWLLAWPFWPRLIVAVLLAFLPIYLANIAFAKRFAATDHAQAAFGVNLLGAILGGCLEYAALLTGYRNLLILVAVLYGLAFLLTPRRGGKLISI
ncbi:spermine/spermidine synthase domain-containing protein [Nakamurella lactea]|uniref:spermine/spermidine synthase domain-containing protein n=1 Tax=Nakamurella lactea TaxID=459515 RepID=UPI000A00D3AC|nr:spermidine synthase [Nakamurella lactea]